MLHVMARGKHTGLEPVRISRYDVKCLGPYRTRAAEYGYIFRMVGFLLIHRQISDVMSVTMQR